MSSSTGDSNNTTSGATTPVAAAAAASTNQDNSPPTLAQALYAVESLVQLFGFSQKAANEAVNVVGVDLTTCYNYILDQGLGTDKGGAVIPIEPCQHVQQQFECLPSTNSSLLQNILLEHVHHYDNAKKNLFQIPCMYHHASVNNNKTYNVGHAKTGGLKSEFASTDTTPSCPMSENWLCLQCGLVLCSRYVNGHGLQHYKEQHHAVAVSLADLSVWCHDCQAYVQTQNYQPLQTFMQQLEQLKFGTPPPLPTGSTTTQPQQLLQEPTNNTTTISWDSSSHGVPNEVLEFQKPSLQRRASLPVAEISANANPFAALQQKRASEPITGAVAFADESSSTTTPREFTRQGLQRTVSLPVEFKKKPPARTLSSSIRRRRITRPEELHRGRSSTRRPSWDCEDLDQSFKRSRSCESTYDSDNDEYQPQQATFRNRPLHSTTTAAQEEEEDPMQISNNSAASTRTAEYATASSETTTTSSSSIPMLSAAMATTTAKTMMDPMSISNNSAASTATTATVATVASAPPFVNPISPTPPPPAPPPPPPAQIQSPARTFPVTFDTSSEEEIDDEAYPFGRLPTSLEDVAKFISSNKCRRIIILTGAGMSVRSGIPDFRSANGLYATLDPNLLTCSPEDREEIAQDPSVALNHDLFVRNPLPCLELNRNFLLGTQQQQWKATLAHRFVELLYQKFPVTANGTESHAAIHTYTGGSCSGSHVYDNKLIRLYTQNIDGLEDQCTKLPRDKVINVHGSMDRAECVMCKKESNFEEFCEVVRRQVKDITMADPTAPTESSPIPCKHCGRNTMKPSITLFKSNLPRRFFELTPKDVENVDLLIVIGTSLKVAPANMIVRRVPKTCLRVVINRDPVGMPLGIKYGPASERDFFCPGDIDTTMLDLMAHLGWLEELEPLLVQDKLPESSAELLRQRLEQGIGYSVDR